MDKDTSTHVQWKREAPQHDPDLTPWMIHQDGRIYRVLEEHQPSRFHTIASFASMAEAQAFLDGLAYARGEDMSSRTYAHALQTVSA